MRACPLCEASIRPWPAARLDLTSRMAFALIGTGAFLALDLWHDFAHWRIWEHVYSQDVWITSISAAVRFGLAYGIMWSRFLHARHPTPDRGKDGLIMSLLIPTFCFLRVLIVGPLVLWFWPERPYV
jgi:hypothetical protein